MNGVANNGAGGTVKGLVRGGVCGVVKAGVIGHPLSHTLSPLIHRSWLEAFKINGSYEAIDIRPEHLAEGVAALAAQGYAGFNVTLPHKQAIAGLCRTLDPAARRIGAVNTVVIHKDGALEGRNTDSFGFAANLREGLGEEIGRIEGAAILVLGAGGAARAAVDALTTLGARQIRIANRSLENAQRIADDFTRDLTGAGAGIAEILPLAWEAREQAAEDAALLVNTTSLGMAGQLPLAFDVARLPSHAAVCDIVYKPLMTPLLQDAAGRGLKGVTGIGMLLHQARPAFAAWFGVMPEIDAALRQSVTEKAR